MNEEEEDNMEEPDEMNEPLDRISEEEADGVIFEVGQDILIHLVEGGVTVGAFIGLSDFGVVHRATHRMLKVVDQYDEAFRNRLRANLSMETVADLRKMAADEEIGLTGLRKKVEIVEEIVDVMIAKFEDSFETRDELTPLKRSIVTFHTLAEVKMIERADEYLEEKELVRFGNSLDKFTGITDDPLGNDKTKGE